MTDGQTAQTHALVERLFALLFDCRALVRDLEPGADATATASEEAERLMYYALVRCH